MDSLTRQRLSELNQEFYRLTADDFHKTRCRPWQGWYMLCPYLKTPLSVLDVGCGNGRFGLFLARELGGDFDYHGIDNNAKLLNHARRLLVAIPGSVELIEQDILERPLPSCCYDLVAVFGVLHHIPGNEQRQKFMRILAQHVRPGGLLAFTCWCFYESPRLRARIIAWPQDYEVEDHDYLLDWRRGQNALRYCHYVDDEEQAALIAATGLLEIRTYRADGNLNRYSILRSIE
jgi:tRNA (uracil-5-)-methyltransferase TRM9